MLKIYYHAIVWKYWTCLKLLIISYVLYLQNSVNDKSLVGLNFDKSQKLSVKESVSWKLWWIIQQITINKNSLLYQTLEFSIIQSQILMGGNFDGYWVFKYLTENILTDAHCLSPYISKRCVVFKQFDGLNFDSLARKHQKRQNFVLYSNLTT